MDCSSTAREGTADFRERRRARRRQARMACRARGCRGRRRGPCWRASALHRAPAQGGSACPTSPRWLSSPDQSSPRATRRAWRSNSSPSVPGARRLLVHARRRAAVDHDQSAVAHGVLADGVHRQLRATRQAAHAHGRHLAPPPLSAVAARSHRGEVACDPAVRWRQRLDRRGAVAAHRARANRLLLTAAEWDAAQPVPIATSARKGGAPSRHTSTRCSISCWSSATRASTPSTPLVLHSYDVAVPRNAGAGFGIGPWLHAAFELLWHPARCTASSWRWRCSTACAIC